MEQLERYVDLVEDRISQVRDPVLVRRLAEERRAAENSGNLPDIAVLYEVVSWLQQEEHPYWLPGSAGSSLLLRLLGITRCHPFSPHCQGTVASYGEDRPIPWQMLWPDDEPSNFEVRLPFSLRNEFKCMIQDRWLFRVCPQLPLTAPAPDRLHFSHIQLVFSLAEETLPPQFRNGLSGADAETAAVTAWRELVADGSEKTAAQLEAADIPQPQTFSDVVYLYGLLHAEGAWDWPLIKRLLRQGHGLSELIAFKDDVFLYLKAHGFTDAAATAGKRKVSYGHGLPEITEEMKTAADSWKLEMCDRKLHLLPKAHAVEYLLFRAAFPDRQ